MGTELVGVAVTRPLDPPLPPPHTLPGSQPQSTHKEPFQHVMLRVLPRSAVQGDEFPLHHLDQRGYGHMHLSSGACRTVGITCLSDATNRESPPDPSLLPQTGKMWLTALPP